MKEWIVLNNNNNRRLKYIAATAAPHQLDNVNELQCGHQNHRLAISLMQVAHNHHLYFYLLNRASERERKRQEEKKKKMKTMEHETYENFICERLFDFCS